MTNEDVLSQIFLPGQGLPMANKLQPTPRLIGRILADKICPKTWSFNYFSHGLSVYVYAIMSKLEVNWAQVTFSNFTKHHSSFLPYGVFLSHIFKKFKVNLSSETNVRSFEFFDHSILLRMKLLNFQTPPTSTPQDHSTSQAHPSKVSHPTRSSIQHFYNAYYNTLHKPSISPLAKKNFFPRNPHEDS